MTSTDWITGLLLGGLLGMLGQGIRIIVGLKKLNDAASAQGVAFGSMFQGSRLGLSMLIGFIAGGLAVIGFAETPGISDPLKRVDRHAAGSRLRRNGFYRRVHSKVFATDCHSGST